MRDKRRHNWFQRWADQGRQARRNAKRHKDTAPAASATTQADQPAVLAQPPATPTRPQAELQTIQPLRQQQTQASEQQRLRSSLSAVWSELQSRAGSADFVALLQQVFGPGRESTAQALADRLAAGDQLGLRFELLSGSVMGGAMGAYAAAGPDGQPTVYINADWLQGASDADLRLVLLEEISHGFDTVMNGGVDTAGDEGEQFSKLFSGIALDPDQLNQIATQDDRTVLTIRGQSVTVEQDNVTAVSAVSFSSDTGSSSSDRTTSTQSQTVTATTTTNNSGGNTPRLFVSTNSGTTRTEGTISGWSDNGGSATFTFNNISLVSGSNSLTFWIAATGGTAVNTTNYILDTTAPAAPTLALGTGISGGATSSEATAAGGVVTVTAESGSSVAVVFTRGANSVTKTVTGNGATPVAVVLAAADLTTLGNGTVSVSATATDAAGNASSAGTTSFTLDTAAPAAPTLALGTGISGGATSSEATAAGGVVTVTAESGSSVAVVFTRGANSVTKTVTGNGATPVAVVLAAADLTTLGNGTVSVSATATDAAGNASSAGTTSFTLDTAAPAAPTLALGTGISGGATSSEATAAGGVVTVTAESGSSVAVVFTRGANSVTKTVTGNGATPVAVVLAAADLTTLGNGTVSVSATATDAAGNASSAGTTSFTLDTAAPAAPTLALGTGISGGATSSEATAAGGVVTVTAESGSSVAVVFTRGANSVTKTVTGNGATPVAVVLAAADLTTLGNGTVSVSATATDAAGNASSAGTTSFTLDTAAPAAPTLALGTGISGGATSSEATAAGGVVTVTAESGSSVAVVFTQGANSVTKTVTGNGATPVAVVLAAADLTTLGNGTVSVSATATDAAGNASSAGTTSFTLDTAAPAAPTLALAADTGTSATDRLTTNASINVAGLESGASWEYSTNSGTSWTAGSGSSFSVDAASYTAGQVQVRQTDLAGNLGTANTTFAAFTVDNTAPNAPSITSVLDNVGTIQGALASGGSSNDTNLTVRVGLAGTNAASGDSIQLHNGLIPLGTAYSITAGDISNGYADVATGTLTNAITYQISAKLTDAAGNASTASSPFVITIDTAAPAAPTLALGTGVSNGATAAEASQLSGVVTVTAETQSTVAVSFTRSGGSTVTRTLIGNGTAQALSLSAAEVASLGDGLISVSATATDAAGNSSGVTGTSFTLDTSAPSALGLTPPADNGVNTNDGITTLNTFTISALETGAIWQFSTDAGTTWSAGSGTTFTAQDGSYGAGDIQVQQIDLAGNAGPISANSSAITINANGAGPTIAAISPAAAQTTTPLNSGIVISFSEAIYANGGTLTVQDGNKANDNLYRMTLTSSQSSGSFSLGTGTWFIAGNKLYIDPDQNFSSNSTFNIDISGSALVNASGIGNTTITSNNNTNSNTNYRFTTGAPETLDSQAPVTSVTSLAFSADSFGEGTAGTSSDFITRTAQQTISGTLSSTLATDELVQISLDNGATWQFADASAGNAFELRGVVLTGSNTLQARVIDGARNAGTSRAQAYVLDTTAPGSAALALQADTGSSLRDGITSNANVLVSQLATDTSWQVSTNSGGSWSTGSGSNVSLAPGSYDAAQVQVRQIDLAGNVSAIAANSQAWIVDTTAPQFLSSGLAAAINENSGANQLIYTPQMAATEALTGGVLRYAISAGDAGALSVGTFNGAVRLLASPDYETKPNYSFTLTATDVAGNASSQTVTLAIADLDEVAPNAPQINVVAGDDTINASEASTTVVVSGSAEAGSTVRVTWGANPARSTTATDGLWSVSFSSSEVPAKGSSTITATATDAAGNVSTLGSRTVVVDRVAPNRPALNTVAGDNRINAAEADAGIVLSGTAEAGSLINANLAGVSRTATAAANGTWTLNYASAQLPADGWASLTVTSSDGAGNVSSAATRQLLVDTTAPQTLSLQAVAGDNRINAAEAAAGIQLIGASEAGAVVQVQWDGSSVGTAVANAQGMWALNLAAAALPADGDRNLLISASDAAGNVSAALSRSINLDRLAPSTPTINSVGNGDVVNAAVAAAGVVVNGTAETGSQISVQWGGLLRTTSTDASGNWSLLYGTSQLPTDGVALISVSSRDGAGNVSSLGNRSVLVDTTPSLTAVSSLRLSADTGTNNNDFITSVAQQTLSGTLSASLQSGETVQISLDGGSQWSSTTTGADLLSFSLPITLAASGTIQARVLDAAGNAGAVANQAYRLDSSASGNGVGSLGISADSGVPGDLLTNVSLQTIGGQLNAPLQAGESVQFRRQLSDGSWGGWGTATSSLNSQAFLFSTSLREGANGFDVRYVDSAGNAGQASNLNVTLDSTAPQVSAILVNGAGLNGSWQAGDLATIQVRFSEAINVTGTPALNVMVGDQSVAATYSGTSGSELTFTTTISADAAATNPIIGIAPGSLDLFNATISDAAGNNALVAISNQLIGSGSADVISGSAQQDVITGAAGADQLSGGGASDLFVYRSAADSNLGSNGASYDRITDFQLGVDQLQLGNQSPISSFTPLGSISDLSTGSIAGLLTDISFATAGFSASFQVGLSSFLAVNDSNAGFSAVDDLLVAIGSQTSASA